MQSPYDNVRTKNGIQDKLLACTYVMTDNKLITTYHNNIVI